MSLVISGLKNQLGVGVLQKRPLSLQQLLKMSSYVPNDPTSRDMWVCLMLSFRSLLQKSNLLPGVRSDLHILRRQDVVFNEGRLLLTVYSSKTLKYKSNVLEIPVARVHNSPLCAVLSFMSFSPCLMVLQRGPYSISVLAPKFRHCCIRRCCNFSSSYHLELVCRPRTLAFIACGVVVLSLHENHHNNFGL